MELISKDALWQVRCPEEDVPLRRPDGSALGTMRLRGLTGEQVNEWQDQVTEQVGNHRRQSKHTMAQLIVRSAITAEGAPYFEPHEVLRVSQMPGYLLTQLTPVAMRLSGLGEDDIKELVEDFGAGPSEPDTTD
ncbi:hypothetical protein [Sphaerisporangium sp. TRM90804]|uniref:hypothetical protein n=1 Tax=Sphaerisporangium sp. TRM90804 TaxID=3031113 RepID=UPI00244CA432|nr:hypothetical protein [Sphaerisporangium sp. TRM90804]MDH2429314.1 hypothetical protein [Sphaerisporangium sp. TRM90804]